MNPRIVQRPFGPHCVFECPRGKGTCSVDLKPTPGDGDRWENVGTEDKPTLNPSINCHSCGFHGYMINGALYNAPPGLATLHVCASCKHPEIITVMPGPSGEPIFVRCEIPK